MPSGELACAAPTSRPATVTEMLDGLAAAGLVARVRSEQDRRVVLTSLTERGARWSRRAAPVRAALARGAREFSDEELLAAAAVLDRLRGLFDEIVVEKTSAAAAESTPPAGRGRPFEMAVARRTANGDPRLVVGRLGERRPWREQDRLAEATSTVNASRQLGPSAARHRALVHIPWAIADGKPNSRALSGWTWIGFRSPETEP